MLCRKNVQITTDRILSFLSSLSVKDQPGRYLPARAGLTPEGERLALGFSCFALKLHHILRAWEKLDLRTRKEWIDFIKSFQSKEQPWPGWNAFADPLLVEQFWSAIPWYRRFIRHFFPFWGITRYEEVLIAESKQAIATLAEVGERAYLPYKGFPLRPRGLKRYLRSLDWSRPWAAGSYFAAISLFCTNEAPRIIPLHECEDLVRCCGEFAAELVDEETGAYFRGPRPEHAELVNGAMKVLTGLDWLEKPIHCPDRLIDMCLSAPPRPDGCHIVDVVYVLYRCSAQTKHRHEDVRKYLEDALEMILAHWIEEEGGFSFELGASQRSYYGVPITNGLRVADLHGTLLLCWALAMLDALLALGLGWRVIKP